MKNISFVTKSPIPENEKNIKEVKGKVVEYEPNSSITVDYFVNVIKAKIEPTYTIYYKIYKDPTIPNKLEPSFEEDYSKYIKIGKYVTIIFKEQLREDSTLVARQIFIWDPEK